MINKVFLVGNLVKDPEMRISSSGTQVLTLNIAVNESRRNAQGQWEDNPNYFFLTMFGNRAESVSKYLNKGSKVSIEGHLSQSTWEKDGKRQSRVEIIVDNIEFMSKANNVSREPDPEIYDVDIPF